MTVDAVSKDFEYGPFKAALEEIRGVTHESPEFEISDSVDQLEARGVLDVRTVVDSELLGMGSTTIAVEAELREGSSLLLLRSGSTGGQPQIELVDGDLRAFSGSGESVELERARDTNNVGELLRQVFDECRAEITLRAVNWAQESGFHWVSTLDRLQQVLTTGWLSFARTIDTGPRVLIVGDMQEASLKTCGCLVLGPEAPRPREESARAPVTLVSRRPDPSIFLEPVWVHRVPGTREPKLIEILNGVARMSIWHYLASSVGDSGPQLTATFLGPRAVTVPIQPTPVASIEPEVELLRWTEAEGTTTRVEFARQALSLAIIDANDVDSAATPALGTARSLYQINQQGSIAQALQARRTALETAWTASNNAASSARDFASKATERTIVQVGVVAGILVAQVREALTDDQAGVLLLVLAGVGLASLLVALATLNSSRLGFDAELAGLREFRDVVADHDLDRISDTPVVIRARQDLRSAKVIATLTYGTVGVIALLSALALLSHSAEQPPTPIKPAPTPHSSMQATR